MSRYIVLMDCDDPFSVCVATDDEGENLVFATADEADLWVQDNAQVGWCTQIVEVEQ